MLAHDIMICILLLTSPHIQLEKFVNFKTYSHIQPRDERKSQMILQGVARQILQKAGARLWWVEIPPSLPLPVVFIGVDVFHAPVVLDPKTKKKGRKSSVAAICVEVISQSRGAPTRLQSYTRTFDREGGTEYFLGDELKQTMREAVSILKVSPASVIVWRDGMPECASVHAEEEMRGIQEGLKNKVGTTERTVPMAYIICQKIIDTKFLTVDSRNGAPSGTLVSKIQGSDPKNVTFYINGRAPPYSTPKPVRFICMRRDQELKQVPLARLTWGQCHAYPNWLGPIKVPSVTMKAHKLAELAGNFIDAGRTIDHARFVNKDFFL
jgi:Piwi domain